MPLSITGNLAAMLGLLLVLFNTVCHRHRGPSRDYRFVICSYTRNSSMLQCVHVCDAVCSCKNCQDCQCLHLPQAMLQSLTWEAS